jgi:exonuclease III
LKRRQSGLLSGDFNLDKKQLATKNPKLENNKLKNASSMPSYRWLDEVMNLALSILCWKILRFLFLDELKNIMKLAEVSFEEVEGDD